MQHRRSEESSDIGRVGRMPRRQFLFQLAGAGAGMPLIAAHAAAALEHLAPIRVDNPLNGYPNRGWERVYRDLYRSDSTFSFLCAPNDTHNCLLTAHVKNGVVTRIAPSYGYGKATDLEGNRATHRWDPRCCQKGLALVRRFYGDRRCKRPMVRRGFKQWIDDGMPRTPGTGEIDRKYTQRGIDGWIAVSWEEAFDMSAKVLDNIARTYSGEEGKRKLLAQGYDELMVEATEGAGVQTLKFRGGMPALGATRIFAHHRLANAMALLDAQIRGVGTDNAIGARNWDSYTWHTDLPPGHPMVTGQQTCEFDLCNAEHAKVVIAWGMNWTTTKMPDSHWLTEARMKGSKVVVIACEYSATMNKADHGLIVRPGTTPALALGFAQVIMNEKLYDEQYVKSRTDLPLLVRMDTGKLLRASEVFADYELASLKNNVVIRKRGERGPAMVDQPGAVIDEHKRAEWGDHVMWDPSSGGKPQAVNRDQIGKHFDALNFDPMLEGTVTVKLADGSEVECRTVFSVHRDLIDASYSPEQVEKLTWAPADAIRTIARLIAANPEKTLFAVGMGPNQFFNNDLKDRAVFLVAALTRNVGYRGGNVGSYAGNYRTAFFSGMPQYIGEDPFDIELDPVKPPRVKTYYRGESAHYFNAGDRILRMGKHSLTGKTHMPVPTKAILVSNSNSLMGTAKGHYDNVVNGYPRVDFIAVSEWWWTASCEYADIVFPVDSWAEFKYPDATISVTNPFITIFPVTPLPRIHDTRSDIEVMAGVSEALARLTGDSRFNDMWKFVKEGNARPYLQRILDHSNATCGYRLEDLEANAEKGIPAIIHSRTYPKNVGWEQAYEDKPWYTKTGRLEFYREEQEFIDSGENLVLHREPVDSTFYEPNVIVATAHPLLRPKRPEDYGVPSSQIDADTRQARHVVRTVEELLDTHHPLDQFGYNLIFHTPKYRHGTHSTPVDTDIVAVWFGPFGDMLRRDKRMPFVTEMFVDINPLDAKALGVEDGDYVHIDADPKDRPFKGWQKNPEWYKVARLLARARYYPGTPRGVTRMWHNAYASSYGSVLGANTNPNGMAKNPGTNYQAMFRTGSQQSCTRAWLKPTWMTDSLTTKGVFGQQVTQGFVPDVHCPTGAPREAMVRITRAEPGGINGIGLWRPAALGLRPTYETAALKKFFEGAFATHRA